jgi:hypothetical protein
MEDWKIDFEWLQIRHYVAKTMNKEKLPDLQSILFLIGIQELGVWEEDTFSKEEKQDLMHIAVCALLEADGYYEHIGRDQDGWPHYKKLKEFDLQGIDGQERYLKEKVIDYFKPNIETSPEVLN